MPHEFTNDFEAGDHRFAIVVSRYNREITDRLTRGAIQTLGDNRVPNTQIDIFPVPGAWELMTASKKIVTLDKYSAIVCLGAVIKGETSHDQHINRAVSMELARMSVEFQLPIALGLLTCNDFSQADDRAGGAAGNKGVEAARAAIEMLGLFDAIDRA